MPKFATVVTKHSWDELRNFINYDPQTGLLTWKIDMRSYRGKAKAGARAGTIDKYGYRIIGIQGVRYWAHRLAWYMHYGVWPVNQIDHINMDFTDDRICNLREATKTQQRANQHVRRDSKSGLKGVSLAPNGRWVARAACRHIGRYDTAEEAHAAYMAAAKRLFGDFARAE